MNGVAWKLKHPRATLATLGYIPGFLSTADPRPAREQFEENYVYGGEWHRLPPGMVTESFLKDSPDDRPLIAEAKLRDETIRVYAGAWVTITQADGSAMIQEGK